MGKAPKAKASRDNSLRRQLANLKREVNPIVRISPVRSNPKPCNVNKSIYVSRTIQVVKQATNYVAQLSKADIYAMLNESSDIRIDFIKVWNATPGSSMKATLFTSKFIDASTTPKDIQGEDFGTQSSLAGLKCDIPMTLSTDITEGASTDVMMSVSCGQSTDKVVFQIGLRMAV